MRRIRTIMMPLNEGRLSDHFGRSNAFACVLVDEDAKAILSYTEMSPPWHHPGLIPHCTGGKLYGS